MSSSLVANPYGKWWVHRLGAFAPPPPFCGTTQLLVASLDQIGIRASNLTRKSVPVYSTGGELVLETKVGLVR